MTPYYSRAFTDRWLESELRVLRGGASGADILDRNENQFFPDYCGRSRLTFAQGEGAFLVNRSGPVRAIRAFLGANSGPMTEHQQIFYEGREEDTTFLRVHSIPGVMSFLDFSAAASGMTYRNNNNPAGVTIDGVADSRDRRAAHLGEHRRAAGSRDERAHLEHHGRPEQVHLVLPRLWRARRPGQTPCQGDAGYYGASGPYVNGSIDSTDEPANGSAPADRLTATRTIFFGAPGASNGALRRQQVVSRLTTNVDPSVTPPPHPGRHMRLRARPDAGPARRPRRKPKLSLELRYAARPAAPAARPS